MVPMLAAFNFSNQGLVGNIIDHLVSSLEITMGAPFLQLNVFVSI
jgi:hypothetical protein